MKRVAVVLLNWNGWRDTLRCIASLKQLDYPDFDVIVVDNGSTDGSPQYILSDQPDVDLVQTGANLGFGGGCNVGMRKALAQGVDYVWLINSDTTVDARALSEMVAVAEEDACVGAVGSVLYEADRIDQVQLWGGGKVRLWTGHSRHQKQPAELDFISGASLLLRRQAIESVGLFDEQLFFMYWEDTDLGFRLRQAGWRLAVAEKSHVWHKESASLGKRSLLLDEYFTRSGVRFLRRHAPHPWFSVPIMVGLMLLKRCLRGEIGRVRAVLKGFVQA